MSQPSQAAGQADGAAQNQHQQTSVNDEQWFQDLLKQSAAYDNYTTNAPILPSQLLHSYGTTSPPPGPSSDHFTVAQGMSPPEPIGQSGFYDVLPPPAPSFAEVANVLINQQLGRVSEGNSVVEPDSVLGESGRLYHGYKEGAYFMPNDAAEQDRLDLQHEIVRILFNGWLAFAPMERIPKYVLDVATGTGVWVHDFAENNPSSFVVGMDLSAIQPLSRMPNCAFIKADAEDAWIFPDPQPDHSHCTLDQPCQHFIKFDYVHLRMVVSCFSDTRNVISHAYDNMNPGGWIEFQDASPFYQQANPEYKKDAFIRFGQECARGAAALGRDITRASRYKQWLVEAGFVDVEERHYVCPLSPWPQDPNLKKVGLYNLKNLSDGLRGIGWMMLRSAGYTPDQVENFVDEALFELRDPQNQPYTLVSWLMARQILGMDNRAADERGGGVRGFSQKLRARSKAMPVTIAVNNHQVSGWGADRVTTSNKLLQHAFLAEFFKAGRILQSSFTQQTLSDSHVSASQNGFVWACWYAYCYHHHLTIRPEDVWFAILTQLSFYVKAHAEDLRDFFVSHKGQKKLELKVHGTSETVDFAILMQQMTNLIAKNVKDPELKGWIMPSFTTTTNVDRTVAAILFMGAMQKYFSYQISMTCGIPTVTLLGDVSDWKDILSRLDKLDLLGEESARFAALLRPILRGMVLSFEDPGSERVIQFWNTIAHKRMLGSGTSQISGWITAFCFWAADGHILPSLQNNVVLDGVSYPSFGIEKVTTGAASVPVVIDDNGNIFDATAVAGSVAIEAFRLDSEDIQDRVTQEVAGPHSHTEATASQRDLVQTIIPATSAELTQVQPLAGWWILKDSSNRNMKRKRPADIPADLPAGQETHLDTKLPTIHKRRLKDQPIG
ncbi:hypothetical protein BX600DRAFT_503350 [Xylariales sp. PMI_506]|nr:hypothetical protein BX600DRAFT_503350 [Xylariales sp. PMI_506]